MESQARKKGVKIFGEAFAESLAESLGEAAGAKMPFEVIDDDSLVADENKPIQFRILFDGAINGECFAEFYEPQVGAFLAKLTGQPVEVFADKHKASFAKLVASAVKKLSASSLTPYGAFNCKLEMVSGLSFGGMLVVPIATSGPEPEMQASLYFGAELLAGLSSPFASDSAENSDSSPASTYNLNLVMDVELNVSLRFGKRQLPLRDVLDLASGSIVELDRLVDEPVELYLDGKLIARGEAVVVDGNYGLRVTEVPQPVASHLIN